MNIKYAFICVFAAGALVTGCATPISLPDATLVPMPSSTSEPLTATIPSTNTFTPEPTKLQQAPYQIIQLDMLDIDHGTAIFMDQNNQQSLAMTRNGWQTWQDITPPGTTTISSIFFQTNLIGFALVNTSNDPATLMKTEDGGQNWVTIPGYPNNYAAQIAFLDDQYGLSKEVEGGAGHAYIKYYETTDSGENWTLLPLISPDPQAGLPEGVVDLCNICQDMLDQTELDSLIVTGEMANEPADTIKITVSNDRGLNWIRTEVPKPQPFISALVAPISASITSQPWSVALGLTSMDNEAQTALIFLQSLDKGKTWTLFDPAITIIGISHTSVHFIDPNFATFADLNNVYFIDLETGRSETASISGLFAEIDPSMLDTPMLDFIDHENGWLTKNTTEGTRFFSTTDAGNSWEEIFPFQVTSP